MEFSKLDKIPVVNIAQEGSDHKVLADSTDTVAGFLEDKLYQEASLIKFERISEDGKTKVKLVANTAGGEGSTADLLRPISPFSIAECNAYYDNNLTIQSGETTVVIIPITISIGNIESIAVYCENYYDLLHLDKLQVAIVSNTKGSLPDSKMEFYGAYVKSCEGVQPFNWDTNTDANGRKINNAGKTVDDDGNLYYYTVEEETNLKPGDDFKRFEVDKTHPLSIKYPGISDHQRNFHYIVMLVHMTETGRGLLAKKKEDAHILINTGKNENYMGMEQNKKDILTSVITDERDGKKYIPSDYVVTTNLNENIPYIEFYQKRG